ncbi:MAG: sulfatase-like hydrolase/transferase, partial [Planctomycetota bacterium]
MSVGPEPQSCRVLGDELANSANTAAASTTAASTTAANTAAARSIDGPDWVRVTAEAPWQARDSQGEVVFRDQLWLLGGWFNSYAAPPRDVWSSADGKTWRQVTAEAPWKHSDLPMTVTHNDRLWLMGGWYNGRLPGHSASNEVWSTGDGVNWRCDTEKAPWSARLAAGLVQFKGKMWLLGGTENYYFGDERSLKNDVWSSVDGREWTCVTEHAGWAPRAYHQAAVLGDKLYVFGGGNYVPKYQAFNDVWCSEDGEHWTCVTERAGWSPRMWFSAVTYRDHLWVLGGWSNNPSRNWGDVWFSPDGKEWTELKSKQIWKERHEHSAYLFQDKIWVAGGHAQPLSNEVWSLDVPRDLLATKPTITPARSESPAPFTAPAPSTAPAPTSSTKRPNIILMIADDLGCTDAAPYEPQAARTPQLARLAREGLRFERAYLTCSSCSPSRSSLITSRYPHNTGASELHQPLPADQVTFVERLRESGYWTAAAGKWHLGPHAKKRFDLVVEAGQALPAGIKRDGSGCEQWLPTLAKRPADKPFFLWLAAFDPHRDYAADTLTEPHRPEQVQVPPYYPDTPAVRRDLAQYYDEVTRLDSYVGQLLDALDEQQLADNTIVLFMTDNGRPFPRSKTTLYDSGIQTPLLIRWPGKVPANRSTASLISSIDIGPTLVEIAG